MVAHGDQVVGDERLHPRRVERARKPRLELDPFGAKPIAQARKLRARLVEQAAVVGQRAEQRVGQFLGRCQVLRRLREMRIRLHARAHEGRDVACREHEVAHLEQRDAVEHGALARGGEQDFALVGELLHR